MPIEPEYVGVTYRQIARLLRVPRGGGRPKIVSERPAREDREGNVIYQDSSDAPTLITFDADCIVDVGMLLQAGAVMPYVAPVATPAKLPKAREGD